MDEAVYRKVGRKYEKIAPFIWSGFPMDGVWIVKYKHGSESSAACVARLDDLPDPFPYYNMMMDRDTIANWFVKTFSGQTISFQEATDMFIKFLSELNKPETMKIKFPESPNKQNLKIPNNKTEI